jgi:hypothetical protein
MRMKPRKRSRLSTEKKSGAERSRSTKRVRRKRASVVVAGDPVGGAVDMAVAEAGGTITKDMPDNRESPAGSALGWTQKSSRFRRLVEHKHFCGGAMSGRGRSSFTKRLKERSRQEKQREKAERKTQRKQEKTPRNPEDDFGTNETLPEDSLSPYLEDFDQPQSSDSD